MMKVKVREGVVYNIINQPPFIASSTSNSRFAIADDIISIRTTYKR